MLRFILFSLLCYKLHLVHGKRKLTVSVSVPHEDPNSRATDEVICNGVTLKWWGIGKEGLKSKSRVHRTTEKPTLKRLDKIFPCC